MRKVNILNWNKEKYEEAHHMTTCPFDILYKYYPPKQWDYIFKDNTIRFTPPPDLNDPFEGVLQVKYICSDEYVNDQFNKIVDQVELDAYNELGVKIPYDVFKENAIKAREYTLFNVKNILLSDKNILIQELYKLTNTYGILSLSERNDNILMWSHYCLNHTGFVIGLNTHHSFFQSDDRYGALEKIKYLHELSNETIIDVGNSIDLFTKKYDLWKYEDEWRVVISLLTYDKHEWIESAPLGVTHLPVDAIDCVIFGVNMKDKDKYYTFLKKDSRYSHIKIFNTILDPMNVALKIVPFVGED